LTSRDVEQRIFVVGVPRSGTTLLQSLLAAHTLLTSFTESHFLSRHILRLPIPPWGLLVRDPRPRLAEFLRENQVPDALSADILDRLPSGGAGQVFRATESILHFIEGLDTVAAARGKIGWVEKTPRHLRFIPLLDRAAGETMRLRFVHVIRQGPATVESLYFASRHWERAYGLRECARRWNSDVAFSLSRSGSPRDHFVFYEDLLQRPEAALRELLDALDLPWQPQALQLYGERAQALTTFEETWKADTGRPIGAQGPPRKALAAEESRRVAGWLRDDLYDALVHRAQANRSNRAGNAAAS
jgi:hypothetical protein